MGKMPRSEEDITLTRILSLIEKNEDGSYKFGAKKAFAESIGYTGGEIINAWENGSSKSYLNKIYIIATVHHVSLAWLAGESDEKYEKNELADSDESISDFLLLNDANKAVIRAAISDLLRGQKSSE